MNAKQIDLIFRAYIRQAQQAQFVTTEPIDEDFKTYGDCEILAKTYLVLEIRLSQRLWKAIDVSAKTLTTDEIYKKGIADVPTELENRLICLELQKRFNLSECPQFKNGLLQIDKRKDFLMPITKDGLITGLRFEYLPSKNKVKQG